MNCLVLWSGLLLIVQGSSSCSYKLQATFTKDIWTAKMGFVWPLLGTHNMAACFWTSPVEGKDGTGKAHSQILFRVRCCHKNNYLGIKHFRTFVLSSAPHNTVGCGVFKDWWGWELATQPTFLEPFPSTFTNPVLAHWGEAKRRGAACVLGAERSGCSWTWSRSTSQKESLSLKSATSASELTGLAEHRRARQQQRLLCDHIGGRTARPVQNSHVFVESHTDNIPVTQCVTRISLPLYIFWN